MQRNFLPLIDVGLFTSIDNPPEPFWNRGTVQFALAGLICFALSRWLFTLDSSTVLLLTSVFRLCPLLLIAKSRSAWPIAFATPYPFDLTLTAYSERGRWLPEDMAMNISGPTAFLILIGGTMFLSIPLSSWLISRSVKTSISEPLRHLGGWLFGITALAVILPIPQWSVFIIRNFAEPFALAGFAAAFGYGIRRR